MCAVLQRIASLANGLSKAELHVLLALAARAEAPRILEVRISSRELARQTGLARSSVQEAIDSLNQKVLIRSDAATNSFPAVHFLICLASVETEVNSTLPPSEVAWNPGQAGLKLEPGVDRESGQGGPNFLPPQNPKSTICETSHRERASARVDSIDKDDFEKIIDRLRRSQKNDYDPDLFELARNQIASHHAKFARPENRIPNLPDDRITAQFLAVAEWSKLSDMLCDLAAERKEAGHSYAWYVTVALQRIHGISPERVRGIRARISSARKHIGPGVAPPSPNNAEAARQAPLRRPPQNAAIDADQLRQQI